MRRDDDPLGREHLGAGQQGNDGEEEAPERHQKKVTFRVTVPR